MKKKVAIITSGHPPFDERIYWKFGRSLTYNNYSVQIICSTKEIKTEGGDLSITGFGNNDITKIKKINNFFRLLKTYNPEVIICCETVTIIPSLLFKLFVKRRCKIIYDVTEWYPEGITYKLNGVKKYLSFIVLYSFNFILSNLTSAIIVGETSKKKRYDFIAPYKKKKIIGYYPVLEYFEFNSHTYSGNNLTLCYAGLINFKRGINRLLKIALMLKEKHKELNLKVKLVGKFESEQEESAFDDSVRSINNIKIEKNGWTEYKNISKHLSDADICFDLRERNFVYNNSLPIKIFEYMACGKPFIFSDIFPIRQELGEINCGFLVDPNNIEEAVERVERYLSNKNLLLEHSKNGRTRIEDGKSWEVESKKLLSLMEELLSSK